MKAIVYKKYGSPEVLRLGIVEAVGKDVTEYKPGDKVFGDLSGYGYGALAEYVCTTIKAIAKVPENISFEEAASLSIAGCTALNSVRDQVSIKPGDTALVNGASGCVGIYAVQLLKSYGAIVTGVCSKEKSSLVKSSIRNMIKNIHKSLRRQ